MTVALIFSLVSQQGFFRYRSGQDVKLIKRILIAIVGGTVLLIGVVLTFLPVPSFVFILAGLGILALEFVWARHWLLKARGFLPGKKNLASTPLAKK